MKANDSKFFSGKQTLACLFRKNHSALLKDVKWPIEQDAVRLVVISSRAPALLIEILHGFAEGMVYYKADIRLVDAHPKSDCGYNDLKQKGKNATL